MMNWRKQRLINELIANAIQEEIHSIGFALPDIIPALKRVKHELCQAGARITQDVGRSRRLIQICKSKTGGK